MNIVGVLLRLRKTTFDLIISALVSFVIFICYKSYKDKNQVHNLVSSVCSQDKFRTNISYSVGSKVPKSKKC